MDVCSVLFAFRYLSSYEAINQRKVLTDELE